MARGFDSACDSKYPAQRFYMDDICASVHRLDDSWVDSSERCIVKPAWVSRVVVGLRFHRDLRDLAHF